MSLSGNRAFKRCDVKVVEFKDFVFSDTGDGQVPDRELSVLDRPTVLSPNPSEDTREAAGSSATLHCPLTEDDRVSIESQFSNHDTREEALKSLRSLAGELICKNCRYSTMSAIEVSQERASLARAETARLEAITSRRQALTELQSIDPEFRLHE